MTDTNDFQIAQAELDEFLVDKGHNALLGIRYNDHGSDWVELAMPWQEKLVGDRESGAFANGPMLTLMDNSAGVAIYQVRGGYLPQVTVDLRADYLRPTRKGATLVCRTEIVAMSDTIAVTRGVAYDETPDDPVCHVTATFMLL